jgi:hypothetical protein
MFIMDEPSTPPLRASHPLLFILYILEQRILNIIFIFSFLVHFNRFPILYSGRGFFIFSLKVENERENIEITTKIENQKKHHRIWR